MAAILGGEPDREQPSRRSPVGWYTGMVGVRRFELRTSSSRTTRSAKLSYTPGERGTALAEGS